MESKLKPLVVLVACAGLKQKSAAPAKDLYTSPLFKGSREYAERVTDRWYILSAKYGLLNRDTVIDPYDFTLRELKSKQRDKWAEHVYESLVALKIATPGARVMFLAGSFYRGHLEKLLHAAGCYVAVPMPGLTIGKQLQWLNRENGRTGR